MTETITPALPPDRWGQLLRHIKSVVTVENAMPHELSMMAEGDRHALAALALHDQPFGFTWEMVDALRHLAADDEGAPWSENERMVLAVAELIVALLPPRET